ncbi:hypothetical protein [Thermococcus barophilus]|uniref:Uncharacterized protein n=2 Tax=Thermococcus barophilus TaxID=55802 RepID=A0A0S1XC06_THEBA|nr:hypothetical protein [Thermococcus barophilus]ADT84113.1 hypothetical protein TERMP_01137 [Thermococcus barophilus MP]ALM75273.1 hypothetical protein TBCH5v1_1353 [Thermococcus barophilus]
MEEKDKKLIESGIEALILGWLAYLFFYQNFLLYKWHRGLLLPSKIPFLVAGILVGLAYFLYRWEKIEKEIPKEVPKGTSAPQEIPEEKEKELKS